MIDETYAWYAWKKNKNSNIKYVYEATIKNNFWMCNNDINMTVREKQKHIALIGVINVLVC